MSSLDDLEDETPPSQGQEIGAAVAAAMVEVSMSNETMMAMIAQSITNALNTVDSKQIVVEKNSVKRWIFNVERNKDGFMQRITAEAQ